MKAKRYTEERGVRILGEVESGQSIAQTARDYAVSEATIHRRRKKFGKVQISEARRLKELEAENRRLKRIVAQQVQLGLGDAVEPYEGQTQRPRRTIPLLY